MSGDLPTIVLEGSGALVQCVSERSSHKQSIRVQEENIRISMSIFSPLFKNFICMVYVKYNRTVFVHIIYKHTQLIHA